MGMDKADRSEVAGFELESPLGIVERGVTLPPEAAAVEYELDEGFGGVYLRTGLRVVIAYWVPII